MYIFIFLFLDLFKEIFKMYVFDIFLNYWFG